MREFNDPPILNIVLLIAALACPQAQQPSGSGEPIKLSTELVMLDVHVFNKPTGRIIGRLRKEDFTLYEEGVKQQIIHFSQDKLPLSIVLLLDVSSSVLGVIDKIRDGALLALQHLKPEDEVALMGFATDAVLIQDFTTDRQLITDKIARTEEIISSVTKNSRVQPDGTHIGDSIHQAANHSRKAANPLGRRIIVTVTDNEPLASWVLHSEKEVVGELFGSGTVVYGLVIDDGYKRPRIAKALEKYNPVILILGKKRSIGGDVHTFARPTGGFVLQAKREEIEGRFAELIDLLRSRYTLGYVPVNLRRDGTFRQIRLKISSDVEKREGKLTVLTRKGYYALRSDSTNQVDSTTPVTTPKN